MFLSKFCFSDFKTITARNLHHKSCTDDNLANQNNTIRESLSRKYESHGIGPSSLPIERQSTNLNNDYSSPNIMDRTVPV